MSEQIDYSQINPGIRFTVKWLNEHGFNTCDSGDGQTHTYECDLDVPYVHMEVAAERMVEEARRLVLLLAMEKGITLKPMDPEFTGPCIDCHYNPVESFATISLFNVMLQDKPV